MAGKTETRLETNAGRKRYTAETANITRAETPENAPSKKQKSPKFLFTLPAYSCSCVYFIGHFKSQIPTVIMSIPYMGRAIIIDHLPELILTDLAILEEIVEVL